MTARTSESIDLEWTSVAKKRSTAKTSSASNAKLLAKGHAALSTTSSENDSPQAVADAIISGKRLVEASTYYRFLLNSILSAYNAKFESIVAFGLGNLTSETSKLQLILYLCLCDSLLPDSAIGHGRSIYDPCISDFDRKVLELLKVPVLTENSKGKHASSSTTLFYLPHCPYRLYCNLLWANWDCFDKINILGNSFQSYNIRRLELNVTTSQSSGNVKTKRSGKKGSVDVALAAAATAPVDFTDTVALLTPFIKEVDTWPAATHNLATLHNLVQNEKTSNIDAADNLVVSVETRETPAPAPAVDRSVFLKEAKTTPALRYLENAMCDMSLMYFPAEVLSGPELSAVLQRSKASEAAIDEASLQDDELF